jgi:hypothetical protein
MPVCPTCRTRIVPAPGVVKLRCHVCGATLLVPGTHPPRSRLGISPAWLAVGVIAGLILLLIVLVVANWPGNLAGKPAGKPDVTNAKAESKRLIREAKAAADGKREEAALTLTIQAVQTDPDNAEAWQMRGYVLLLMAIKKEPPDRSLRDEGLRYAKIAAEMDERHMGFYRKMQAAFEIWDR